MLKKSVIILAGMLLLITSCFANTRMQQSAKQQAIPKVKEVTIMDFSQEKENVIYLAGGCFWGLEKLMQSIPKRLCQRHRQSRCQVSDNFGRENRFSRNRAC